MIVIHKYGEPENPGDLATASNSILGNLTGKGEVVKSFLLEVGGHRRFENGNYLYDKKCTPK